jgi:ribulose-phosphate 3-epimerase
MSVRVLASLRSARLDALDQELAALEAGGIEGYHLDVMDGVFVPETCFDPGFCATLRAATTQMIDVHLMVEDPLIAAPRWAQAGADRVSFHVEAAEDARAVIDAIRGAGAQPGIVCFPRTSLATLAEFLPLVAVVNPLGVDPQQKLGFQETTYQRVANLAAKRTQLGADFRIQADGGVWEKTRQGLVEAGADELVGGYPIFSSDDYGAAISALRG